MVACGRTLRRGCRLVAVRVREGTRYARRLPYQDLHGMAVPLAYAQLLGWSPVAYTAFVAAWRAASRIVVPHLA